MYALHFSGSKMGFAEMRLTPNKMLMQQKARNDKLS
jgi:hypothetical protein